jgi:hypothetical protein
VVATDADLIDAAANARGSPTPSRVDSLEHRRPGRSCTWWRWWLDGPRKPGVGGARRPIMLPSWTTTSRPRRTQMPGCFTRRRIVSAPPSVRATTFGNPRRCPALREVRPGHVTRRPSVERPGRLDRVAAKVVEVSRRRRCRTRRGCRAVRRPPITASGHVRQIVFSLRALGAVKLELGPWPRIETETRPVEPVSRRSIDMVEYLTRDDIRSLADQVLTSDTERPCYAVLSGPQGWA